jgi:hypothetical protein
MFAYVTVTLNQQNKLTKISRTALFSVITQRVVVISYRRFGTTYRSQRQWFFGFLNPEDGTDKLYRNVGKKLPLLAA